MICNKCDFSEEHYRGPAWTYPCMQGYQGPKREDINCKGKDGCFRLVLVQHGGTSVVGTGGCFEHSKKACVEEVTKSKFHAPSGCISETTLEPSTLMELKEKCGLNETLGDDEGGESKHKRNDAGGGEVEGDKGFVCVCGGAKGCNNLGAVSGRSAVDTDTAVHSVMPVEMVWIGVFSGVSLVGGFFLTNE